MNHPIYRVTGFEKVGSFTLRVSFDDGTQKVIDFKPVLAGNMYASMRDERVFNQVKLDPEIHTLVWPNGADFDPATLHDWDKYAEEMRRMAQAWTGKEQRTTTR